MEAVVLTLLPVATTVLVSEDDEDEFLFGFLPGDVGETVF